VSECKGLIFRGYNNVFKRKSGHYEQQQGFRLAKRLSCKGCAKCGSLLDYADDILCEEEFLHIYTIKEGNYYTLSVIEDGVFNFKEIKK